MGLTPTYQLPYPEAADPADVPVDMRELAERLDLVIPPAVVVAPWREVGAAGQPTFLNNYVNNAGGKSTCAFFKDPFGIVHLKGTVRSGVNGQAVYLLPSGFWPAQDERIVQLAFDGSTERIARLDISAVNGQVVATIPGTAAAPAELSMNGHFRAA